MKQDIVTAVGKQDIIMSAGRPDTVEGWRPGTRVLLTMKASQRLGPGHVIAAEIVSGTVRKAVVPKRGRRFYLVEDDFGRSHHAFNNQLTELA